ncbi:thiol reductant ABC exporter subunit CydC [Schumannella soli]|uniref:Thiol reductant ABC exporter subunit CydC n=1 Tax=Schumannella soli TaxID=2590779 RepID=A0A506XTP0_9MICO|nr:thiol reductant ABC exporter subunit CydC [Schumannella soli]TPW76194.1 thiol reductant ABC exporter subunit CydC [Schumannella soli]
MSDTADRARRAETGIGRDPQLQRELLLRDRPRLVGLTLLTLLRAAGVLLIAEGLARGITAAVAGDAGPVMDAPLLLLAGGILARIVAEWATRVVAARTGSGIKAEQRRGLLGALLRPGVDTPRVALLAGRRLDELDRYFLDVVPATLGVAVVPAAVLVRVLGADLLSTIILVLTLPLVPVFLALVGMHTRDEVARASTALDRLAAHLVELARGLPVIVGLGRLDEQRTALTGIAERHRRATVRTLRTAFLSALVLELIATISVAVVAVVIGIRLIGGALPLETALLVLVLAPECFAPFRALGSAFHAAEDGLDALRRARMLISGGREPEQIVAHRVALDDADAMPAVRLAGVSVTYVEPRESEEAERNDPTTPHPPVGRTPALARMDAEHRGPGLIAVTARSGGGKSTLLTLLADRLAPEALVLGEVTTPAPAAVARQHPRTTEPRVLDELLLWSDGAEGASRAMAERLGLLPLLGHDPATLSPGELRRLAVARAALRLDAGARMAVLDEPSSQLDAASAATVRGLIHELAAEHLVVVATHDPLLVALADRRWSLDDTASAIPATTADEPGSLAARGAEAGTPSAVLPTAMAARERQAQPADRAISTAHEAEPDDETALRASRPRLAAIATLLAPELPRLLVAAVLGAAATASAAALTGVSGWLIVRAGEHVAIMYLLVAIVGVRFFGIARAVLRYLERLFGHDAALRGAARLRGRLWSALAALGPGYRRATRSGETLDMLVGVADTVRDLLPRVVTPVLGAALSLAAWIAASAIVLPDSLAVTLPAALFALVAAPVTTLLADGAATRRIEVERAELLRGAATAGDAADELVPAGLADRALTALRGTASRLTRAEHRGSFAAGAGSAVVLAALGVATVLLLDLSARAVAAGSLTGPFVAVLALLPLALIEAGESAVDAARRAPALVDALGRIAAVPTGSTAEPTRSTRRASATTTVHDAQLPAGDAIAASSGRDLDGSPALVLDGVALRWPGGSRVVDGLDAVATPSQWLVVDGPSGSGKSTLLSAVLGQLAPEEGRILLPETPTTAAPANPASPHEGPRVTWAPQDAHVFDASLRANLRLGRPAADAPDDDELIEVLHRVGLGRVLDARDGLDTRVGAGGAALSGGERQRLAVARTLLSRADVVLIDEPTAHLDAATASALLAELRSALDGRIVVLVSHDPGAAEPGDLRLTLGAGATHRQPLLVL